MTATTPALYKNSKYDVSECDIAAAYDKPTKYVLVTGGGIASDEDGSSDGKYERAAPDVSELRARARDGERRRKKMRQPLAKRLRGEAQSLWKILLTCSLMVGAWTEEVMGEPLWDAWAVLQPKHHVREEDHARAECLESFAGQARISGTFARHRHGCLEPRDLCYDHDLKSPG
jgi:hypothetical protein